MVVAKSDSSASERFLFQRSGEGTLLAALVQHMRTRRALLRLWPWVLRDTEAALQRAVAMATLLVLSSLWTACRGAPRGLAPVGPRDPRADFRPTPWEPFSPDVEVPRPDLVHDVLCRDVPWRCEAACGGAREPSAFAECAVAVRYADDRQGVQLAQAMLARTGTVPGIETRRTVFGAYLGNVPVEPAIPIGPDRYHLSWILASLDEFEKLFAEVVRVAPRPVLFRTRPRALRFYRTAQPSFPSASATLSGEGIVTYNLRGVLHTSREDVAATLFHELFHLNDQGHGRWSEHALAAVFEEITTRCGADHACYAPYAPDTAVVPGGTYYAFDPRTRSTREYAAELGLRWFREHRAVVFGGELRGSPFRCRTDANRVAWELLIVRFFGGIDLLPRCDSRAE